ncbi:Calcium channel YVC1 [Neolecta irregularis DAH-3]|uniref:Calcium channel YVC1 n=1 Tax=Neolecta irregularis (strain DAH-3) TaxID=1198029 RepID=A0A1U7LGK6_NEOID|nr:Calcium channel YVC1 [Neolecta irregularis DAH-3]|eukprot:OLL21682.1 Calcium channel YVC1 [Neolecta irregularis DAH-3]
MAKRLRYGFLTPAVNKRREVPQRVSRTYDEEAVPGSERDPLLLSFAAHSLDNIPVYPLTHALRDEIHTAVDTTLTWEQLRSPQVNQFLVRPILTRCKGKNSRAIVFALLANCVQFRKEAVENASKTGASISRGLMCELLAIKILKDFSPRELIDVLSFDFWPLQGDPSSKRNGLPPRWQRISALEIAIRAEAKHFLANPLVVHVLENIWAGNIVFHLAADKHDFSDHYMRKAASIYDARESSIFKLSRLRVPRYKHYMQTTSFAILLILYIAVLVERRLDVGPLEIFMVLWSFGFMLDEVVGFLTSGTSLYLLNLWNLFDVFILLFFSAFVGIRIYGVLTAQDGSLQRASTAYDVLAVNAIFLLPRLFTALDHQRYFSHMLVSFRKMCYDLIVTMLFVVIFFSGFFLAFSAGFARETFSPGNVAYMLGQIFLGFTLPAWNTMHQYNLLGQICMLAFVATSHFLVVTILVSVLSNTFSHVIDNAHEEHQYLFAVNTITAVKSDALFQYQSPFNLIEWAILPLIYVMPRYNFVRMNRYVIKFTHFPILFTIYLYERFYLLSKTFEPNDLLLSRTRSFDTLANGFSPVGKAGQLKTKNLLLRRFRRESIATQGHEVILDEMFKRLSTGKNNNANARNGNATNPVISAWIKSTPVPGSPLISEIPRKTSHFGSVVFQGKSPYQSRVVSQASNAMDKPLVLSDPENFVASTHFRKRPVHNTQSDVEGSDRTIETEEEQGDDEDPGTDAINQDDDDVLRPYTVHDISTPTPSNTGQFQNDMTPKRPTLYDRTKSGATVRRADDRRVSSATMSSVNCIGEMSDVPSLRVFRPRPPNGIEIQPRVFSGASSEGQLHQYAPSSFATQFALHNDASLPERNSDEMIASILFGRLDNMENLVKERVDRVESALTQMLREVKRLRKADRGSSQVRLTANSH